MWKKATISLLAILVVSVTTATLSLRDNPARPTLGEPKYTQNGDTRIEYVVAGPSQGKPIILLASFARSISDFNELARDLHQAGYRTLSMYARGIGGSELPDLKVSLFDYADDLAAVLRNEGLNEPLVIIGHAFGNRIARAFASRHPHSVDSLILLAAGDSSPPKDTRNNIMKVVFQLWPEKSRRNALQRAFFAPNQKAPEYWLKGWYPRAALAQAYATANTPLDQWRSAGNSPILVILPDHDAAAADATRHLKMNFPNRVSLIPLAGAGHAMLPEQPALIADHILRYLAGHQ